VPSTPAGLRAVREGGPGHVDPLHGDVAQFDAADADRLQDAEVDGDGAAHRYAGDGRDRLRTLLMVGCLAGVVTAGATGLLLTRRTLAPMARLTATAEHIARTEDLETPVTRSARPAATRSAGSAARSRP
jgi:hypothetical protein